MARILFVGDVNVDLVLTGLECFPVPDREITCEGMTLTMGSAAVVAACTYTGLGGEAAMCGLAGADSYGDFMLAGLAERGIDASLVRRTSDVATGLTVNLVLGNTRTQVTYLGTIDRFDGSWLGADDLAGFRHVHFAGIYLQTALQPHLTGLLEAARGLGVTTSLDPQWDAKERWEGMDEWLPLLSYLFVNEDEAVSIAGAGSPAEACGALAERTRCPLVKAGADGAYACVDGETVRVPAFRVEPVDTTGAGDSFCGGFLHATLDREMDLNQAARFANGVAGRSCLFAGGTTARSSYQDVMDFMGEHE